MMLQARTILNPGMNQTNHWIWESILHLNISLMEFQGTVIVYLSDFMSLLKLVANASSRINSKRYHRLMFDDLRRKYLWKW